MVTYRSCACELDVGVASGGEAVATERRLKRLFGIEPRDRRRSSFETA
jgi:hypothetical protein